MPAPALVAVAALALAAEASRRIGEDALLDEAADRAGKILQAPVSHSVRRDDSDISVKFSSGKDLIGLFVVRSARLGDLTGDESVPRWVSIAPEYEHVWEQAGRPPVWRVMFSAWERPGLQGRGIGTLVYRWFVAQVSKQGGFLAPDEFSATGSTSEDAQRVWGRLRSRPQIQSRGPMVRLREGSGARAGSRGLATPFEAMTPAQRNKVKGAVLYEGPSRINGVHIVAILTYGSKNKKTGDIPQVWILQPGVHPFQTRVDGSDVAVCGGCILAKNRGCYVNWTPLVSILECYGAGKYGDIEHARWRFDEKPPEAVRIGAYGDPVAVPLEVWERLAELPPHPTIIGYTQMWRSPLAKGYQKFCMASTKSPREYADARRMGWRSFRAALPQDATPVEGQRWCPATVSDETCKGCQMCSGGMEGPDIMVQLHGAGAAVGRATESLQRLRDAGRRKGSPSRRSP